MAFRRLFDQKTTPREVCAAAGIRPGTLAVVSLDALPGFDVRVRSAVKYFLARIHVDKETRETFSLGQMRDAFNGPRAGSAWENDCWPDSEEAPKLPVFGGEREGRDIEPPKVEAPTVETVIEAPVVEAPVVQAPSAPAGSGLDAIIAHMVAKLVSEGLAQRPAINPAEVAKIIEAEFAKRPSLTPEAIAKIARESVEMIRVEVKLGEGQEFKKVAGHTHRRFADLLKHISLGDHVYLHGPAGSGKSTAARQAAEALGLALGTTGKVDSKYDLLGFRDAHGRVVRTPFREIWEAGGVFLFDEMDRSDPSAVVALNNGLATGAIDFPDGTSLKHAKTIIIGGGNTVMGGADRTYTAGVAQDGAVKDRFVFLSWGYDEALERRLCGDDPQAQQWCRYVQTVRAEAAKLRIDIIASPRASINGARALLAGIGAKDVAERYLWKGLDRSSAEKLSQAVTARLQAEIEKAEAKEIAA